MSIQVEVDSESVNKAVTDAIIESAIGKVLAGADISNPSQISEGNTDA